MKSGSYSRRLRALLVRVAIAATSVGIFVSSSPAWSQDSAYCRRVRARAASDAALLFAPTVEAQGIKFPRSGSTDVGVTSGAGLQFRAALSFSPLDFYKGFRVKRVGEADCQQHEAVVSAQEVLAQGTDYGRLPALRKQLAFMESREATCQAILAKSKERVAAHVVTLREATEIRARVAAIGRAREHTRGDIDRLEARGIESYRGPLSVLVDAADRQAMELEREVSHVRSLDAWSVGLTGGVIPQDRPVDYFAMVHVGFNFGGFSRNAEESKYLDARGEELKKARYELRDQVQKFRGQLKSALAEAKRDLAIVDEQAAMLAADTAALSQANASDGPHALAMLELDAVAVESERAFLTALIDELRRLQENDHGNG